MFAGLSYNVSPYRICRCDGDDGNNHDAGVLLLQFAKQIKLFINKLAWLLLLLTTATGYIVVHGRQKELVIGSDCVGAAAIRFPRDVVELIL